MVGDVRIARGIEFQMTGAAERKEREPMLVLDGVDTRKCFSLERRTLIALEPVVIVVRLVLSRPIDFKFGEVMGDPRWQNLLILKSRKKNLWNELINDMSTVLRSSFAHFAYVRALHVSDECRMWTTLLVMAMQGWFPINVSPTTIRIAAINIRDQYYTAVLVQCEQCHHTSACVSWPGPDDGTFKSMHWPNYVIHARRHKVTDYRCAARRNSEKPVNDDSFRLVVVVVVSPGHL